MNNRKENKCLQCFALNSHCVYYKTYLKALQLSCSLPSLCKVCFGIQQMHLYLLFRLLQCRSQQNINPIICDFFCRIYVSLGNFSGMQCSMTIMFSVNKCQCFGLFAQRISFSGKVGAGREVMLSLFYSLIVVMGLCKIRAVHSKL